MKKIKIGLVGLGVVGKSVYDLFLNDHDIIDAKSGSKLQLVAVSSRIKKDFVDESKVKFFANAIDLANDPEIDVVVEMIGGDSIARQVCEAALKNGKKVVTANKALIATQGLKLSKLAEDNNSHIFFEAGVGGGTPMVKLFREGLAANKINSFYAILNGTSNFILTKMKNENIDFSVALKQAQDSGFAELDPTFDIEGTDAAHKLTILASIASNSKPNFDDLFVEGISKITIDDINLADELGYKIKLLAVYKDCGAYKAVYPALVNAEEKIANIDGSFNALFSRSSSAQESFLVGRGAGGAPTSSAIVADLIDIANERYSFVFGAKSSDLVDAAVFKIEDRVGRYFINLLLDKNLAQNQKLDQKFLEEIKVEKSYFREKESQDSSQDAESGEVVCGLITGNIKEINLVNLLKNLDKNLVKQVKFLRVEETEF